jgi:methylglutaconyl-CoA hydratase
VTVAAIHGTAFGGGLETAMSCHYRCAVPSAQVGQPEVKLGIIPGAGGTQRLSRLCGIAAAKDLILTGRRIDAASALRLGLVSRVVPVGELERAVGDLCAELGTSGPLALTQAKRAIDRGFGQPLREALAIERAAYEAVLGSEDRNEGLRAFAEKRLPRFKGR